MRVAQDRLCLRCESRRIIGKPYSVYVCRECYLHGQEQDESWHCTDLCDHGAGVYQCEQIDGSEGA